MTKAESKLKEALSEFKCKMELKDNELKRVSEGLNKAFGKFRMCVISTRFSKNLL